MFVSKKNRRSRKSRRMMIQRDQRSLGKNVNLKKTKNAKRTHLVSMSNSKAATSLRRNGFVSKSHFSSPKSHFWRPKSHSFGFVLTSFPLSPLEFRLEALRPLATTIGK
jgi:hypothetical protein